MIPRKYVRAVGWLLVTMALSPDAAFSASRAEIIRDMCATEWPDDFNMQAFCVDQQTEAASEVDAFRSAATSDPVKLTIANHCMIDWSSDFTMLNFCFRKQSEAHAKLGDDFGLPDDVRKKVGSSCQSDWADDFIMQVFCIRQQAKGWRRLNQ